MALLRWLPLPWAVLSAACVSVTTLDGDRLAMASPEFRAYVESVFRDQNRVATELALTLDAPGLTGDAHAALESAELELLRACGGLNAIAAERRDGRGAGRLAGADAARRAPECERATGMAEAAILSVRQQPADAD
jgi:hypothetical protein